MTRRQVLTGLGVSVMGVRQAFSQAAAEKDGGPRAGAAPLNRATPLVCAFSNNLARVPYAELGTIAQQIGYDGVDLTVMEGGHVSPFITNVDLVRAIESVRGPGLEVPMISTNITSISDSTAYPILAITGHTQVHLYRMGYWPWGATPNVATRLTQVRNDLINLVSLGQRTDMVAALPNRVGSVGQAIWDAQTIISDLDPRWMGYCFDPSQAVAEGAGSGWEIALRLALPRVKAVALQDFYWTKDAAAANGWKMQMCPMGEGMVDWDAFFRILGQSGFSGPVSMHYEYQAKDAPGAMAKDLEFVRKRIEVAWKSAPRSLG